MKKNKYPKNRNSKSRRLTNSEFLNKLYLVKNKNEFTVLDEYVTSQVSIRFLHIPCNTIFYATPNNMLKSSYGGCPICGKEKRKNTKRYMSNNNLKSVMNEVNKIYPNFEYILLIKKSEYINNKKPSLILKCSRCENEFPISLVNLRKKRGCPICNKLKRQESMNVKRIKNYLISSNINFITEYKLSDCRNKRELPFDFAFNINGKLKLLEYDGEFHDRGYNNNTESLERIKENDKIKTEYCLKNNIPFLRLRYNDFINYKERIKDFLSV